MTVVPLSSRICALERLIMPWRLPAWAGLSLPFAVNLKRFLALDFVFILGILRSPDWWRGLNPAMVCWAKPGHGRIWDGHGMPCTRGGPKEAASYTEKRPVGKPLGRLLRAEHLPRYESVEE